MQVTFDFQDMPLCGEDGVVDDTEMVDVEIDLEMTEQAEPGIAPSLNHPGEPSWPAVWEIQEVRLIHTKNDFLGRQITTTLKLTEEDFVTFFAPAADIINNAHEWAPEQEIE